MDSLLIRSADGECFAEQLKPAKYSVFETHLDFDQLERHLGILVDVIHPSVIFSTVLLN